jgi:hypothetical protein
VNSIKYIKTLSIYLSQRTYGPFQSADASPTTQSSNLFYQHSCDKIYDLGTFVKAKKGAGIGYGTKSDFTEDLTCSPASTKYNSFSGFHENKIKNRGFSLSVGR